MKYSLVININLNYISEDLLFIIDINIKTLKFIRKNVLNIPKNLRVSDYGLNLKAQKQNESNSEKYNFIEKLKSESKLRLNF